MGFILSNKQNPVCIDFLSIYIRTIQLTKNVMTETGVLPVNENANHARPNATN